MISIIIPFYNEKENLPILLKELIKELNFLKKEYEIILVNDGSTDDFQKSLLNFKKNQDIKLFNHKKRYGKGLALKTGIDNSNGDILVFIDADLQNDPKDISKFIKKIEEGFDFVNGIRIGRHKENFLLEIYSRLAEFFLKKIFHSPFSDINCGYKALKKEVLKDFVFYGNNFRFFPLYVFYSGFKVTEIKVKNHLRKFGKSKFGPEKIFIGIFDMLTAFFIYKFSEKPLHFFGIIGGINFFLGGLILFYLAFERIFFNIFLYRRPILFLGMLLVIVGIQIIMTGILGELIVYLNKKRS